MTTRERSPWSDDMRTWPVFPADIRDVRKCTSYVKAFESYRITPLVRRGHFPSRDKDGGHMFGIWIGHTWKPHATRNYLTALSFIEPELWAIEVCIAGMGIFDLFCSCDLDLDPMMQCFNNVSMYICMYVYSFKTVDKSQHRQYRQ